MLIDAQIIAKYGAPGDPDNLTVIQLPYPMRVAWDIKTSVSRITCHRLIADALSKVFSDLLAAYGYEELKRLGIDLFGGCYNFRKMRGGNRWSRHSWAIAIDLNPAKNGLRTKWKDAQFSKPEYSKMVEIFYNNGFMSYGKERDYDAMHWEINS